MLGKSRKQSIASNLTLHIQSEFILTSQTNDLVNSSTTKLWETRESRHTILLYSLVSNVPNSLQTSRINFIDMQGARGNILWPM